VLRPFLVFAFLVQWNSCTFLLLFLVEILIPPKTCRNASLMYGLARSGLSLPSTTNDSEVQSVLGRKLQQVKKLVLSLPCIMLAPGFRMPPSKSSSSGPERFSKFFCVPNPLFCPVCYQKLGRYFRKTQLAPLQTRGMCGNPCISCNPCSNEEQEALADTGWRKSHHLAAPRASKIMGLNLR
jgi:hypothetical protein